MKDLILNFPQQISDAIKLFSENKLPSLDRDVRQILVCGLGGSGIGGTIAAEISYSRSAIPLFVSKDYSIPHWVNQQTLVIISSYSGNTEETLEAFQGAIDRNALIYCITSGGKTEEIARNHGFPTIIIPGGMPPRACLGFSLTQILGILDHYQFVPGLVGELSNALLMLKKEAPAIINEAESIGRSVAFTIPVIYTSAGYEGIAIRLRQQLNENAKMLCWHHVVPEMNHNELVGWVEKSPRVSALFLRNEDEYYRTAKRMDICREVIYEFAGKTIEIKSKGRNPVERMLYWIHLGDWISWFASVERNQDAMQIQIIEKLKAQLSKLQ